MSDELKLLIIADKENQLAIQESLRKTNLPVTIDVTHQGAVGLELVQQIDYYCLFIDLQLPDIDGISFVNIIRERGVSSPILLLVSSAEAHLAIRAAHQGITDFLLKDFLIPETVLKSISSIRKLYDLEQKRLTTETALKLIQDSLRESQKLAKIGNWEYNYLTGEMFWSEEIYRILELDWNSPFSLEDYISRVHPDDMALREGALQEAINQKTNYQVDYRLVLPSDKIKYTTANGTPIFDEEQNLVGFIGTLQDISDRINTRNALKESEERYLMLIETMNEGVIHLDANEVVVFANKQFCEKMGYKKKEVIGKPFDMFIPDAATQALIQEKTVLRQKLVSDQYEVSLKKKNGELVCFLIGASPIMGSKGEILGSLGALSDITERKKIEEALSSSEKLFRTLFENTQGFICTHALDGQIISINQAGAAIFGLEPQQLVGQNFKSLLGKDVSVRFEHYLQTLKKHKQAGGILKVTDNQQKNHYLLYRNTLYQEAGKEAYVIASAQDITERIGIEKELTKAKIIAERSVKIKEQFLANISHEIRTPMNGILGLTSVLQKMIQDEEQRQYLQAIQSSADKLLVIINDILDFSKIEAGKIDFEETEFNPTQLVKESINLLEPKAAEKKNKLKAIIDTDVPEKIKGDPGKLSQIINNLLSNAIKFTHEGFIKIIVEVAADQPEQVILEFTIEDNGIGIPEDKLNSIFESFTQASSSTTRKYGGTGLGLTISKQFIELQGGIISVKSKPNEGSSFTFRLTFNKITTAATAAIDISEPTALPPIQAADLGKLRVLLAEDNEINQLLVKKVMSEWGFPLDIASNGVRALELFQQREYDIILMDMQMPEMDGYKTTAAIRAQNHAKKHTPIIALTAHASAGEATKCLEAGADTYLSKPFKADNLLQEIAALLKNKPEDNKTSILNPLRMNENNVAGNSANYATINLTYLREMASGDSSFMEEIMDMFIQQTPENLTKLREYTVKKQWPEVKSLAHKMKSSVILVGIQELEDIFVNLQKEALGSNPEKVVPPLVERAQALCAVAIAELKTELKALKSI